MMIRLLLFIALGASVVQAQLPSTKPTIDYTAKVKPIFAKHCYECHSEARKKEKAGFVFDKPERMAKNIGRGGIIIPGSVSESDLIAIVMGADGKKLMPPESKDPLSQKEIDILKTWIEEGANVPGIDIAKRVAETAGASTRQFMNWTSTEGKPLRAKFVRLEGESVVLEVEGGTVYAVPLTKLNPAGRVQAAMQAKK
jgi:hypothetical protein